MKTIITKGSYIPATNSFRCLILDKETEEVISQGRIYRGGSGPIAQYMALLVGIEYLFTNKIEAKLECRCSTSMGWFKKGRIRNFEKYPKVVKRHIEELHEWVREHQDFVASLEL